MTETRAARVEQNTRHKAEPSTLYQIYRCINIIRDIVISIVELSRQMSSCKDLVVEPSQLGSLKGLNGTMDTRIILVRPLTVKVKAYVQLRWYCLGFQ